jgi:hypothetical protein
LKYSIKVNKVSNTKLNLFGLFGKKKEDTTNEEQSQVVAERKNKFQGYGRDIFKKTDEKKDITRLAKNMLFPGIYQDYEDTKEVKQTIVIGKTASTGYKSKEVTES